MTWPWSELSTDASGLGLIFSADYDIHDQEHGQGGGLVPGSPQIRAHLARGGREGLPYAVLFLIVLDQNLFEISCFYGSWLKIIPGMGA